MPPVRPDPARPPTAAVPLRASSPSSSPPNAAERGAPSVRRVAAYVAGVYLVAGCLWILLSDRALEWATSAAPADLRRWAQTYKGWFFVATTAALLYALTARALRQVRQGQRAVADGERLLRGVVDSEVVAICFWHADGRVLDANASYLDLVGHDAADVRAGRVRWRDMTPARFAPLDEAAVAEAVARGASEPYEKEYVRPDGRHVPVLVRVAALRGEADVGVAAVIDISQRKDAEERARHLNAELANAGRLKDQFLAVLSHELRTPVTSIRLWTQLLRAAGSDADADPAVSAEALAMIEHGVESQTQLINDLLDVSRIASGHLRLESKPADLCPLIRAAAAALEPAARENGVALDVEVAPGPLAVVGDAGRLRQVAWNLLSNAIKFTPAGGRVGLSLSARPRNEGEGEAGEAGEVGGAVAVLAVRDTGIGIDPAFIPQLFECFRQADSSTTRRHGGLGIGLSIVKRLVELQGGTVRVASAGRGRGATFTVELPLAAGVPIPPASPADPECGVFAPAAAAADQSDVAEAADAAEATAAPAPARKATVAPPPAHAPRREEPAIAKPAATPPPSAPPVPARAAEPEVLAGVRVMVVDDHEETCRAVARLLRSHGATVLTAHAVEPALRLLDSITPDVLVSDIGLPDADGHDLIRAVRARETAGRRNGAERHLCAIALTAYAMPEDRAGALGAGFDDYLSKPIDFNELLDKVRALAPATTAER